MTRNITFKIKEMLVNFVLTSVVTFNNGFIQVHYPVEAIPSIPFSDSKGQLLEAQVSSTSLRTILPEVLIIDPIRQCSSLIHLFPCNM